MDHDALATLLTTEPIPNIDWSCSPWAKALPVLCWLGKVPPSHSHVRLSASEELSEETLAVLTDAMLRRLQQDGEFAWSSYMLQTGLKAIADSLDGPPEPFLLAVWKALKNRKLNKNVYEFSRAVGIMTLRRISRLAGVGLIVDVCTGLLLGCTSVFSILDSECSAFPLVGRA